MRSSRKNAGMNNSKLYVGGEYDGMVQNLGSFYFLWFLNIFLSLFLFYFLHCWLELKNRRRLVRSVPHSAGRVAHHLLLELEDTV